MHLNALNSKFLFSIEHFIYKLKKYHITWKYNYWITKWESWHCADMKKRGGGWKIGRVWAQYLHQQLVCLIITNTQIFSKHSWFAKLQTCFVRRQNKYPSSLLVDLLNKNSHPNIYQTQAYVCFVRRRNEYSLLVREGERVLIVDL